ncbi:MAG: TetR/AcrR family transcriptional regulator [Bacteroidota bacterium]
MKKTKEKILDSAQQLFNKYGVADVSLRKISSEIGISHTNLIYHFKTKNEILDQLHLRILSAAKRENDQLKGEEDTILGLLRATESGFEVLYKFRFFMIDLNYIMRTNKSLHNFFLEVEQVRAQMYRNQIKEMITKKLMRKEEYESEYEKLITQIRIFSDYWISSSAIYCDGSIREIIKEHVEMLMNMFYPYLTTNGKKIYKFCMKKL